MALNEKAVKELLGSLVSCSQFATFEDRETAEALLTDLDTAHNDATVAAEQAKAEQEARDAQNAEDAAFAERVRRYNESNGVVTPQESPAV